MFKLTVSLFLCWIFPLYGLIYNQLNPNYQSALGVAYAFVLGCVVHSLTILFSIVLKRMRFQKSELITLLISFSLMILLTIISNGGYLSKINS